MKPDDVSQEAWDAANRACMAAISSGEKYGPAVIARAITAAVAAEREAIMELCREQQTLFLSTEYASNQPMGSLCERFAIEECIAAIRNRVPPC